MGFLLFPMYEMLMGLRLAALRATGAPLKILKTYGAFFLSKFNLLVVFTYDLRFSNSILLLLSIGIRFSTSTFVLFNLDFPFLSSTFFYPSATFVI